MADFTIGDVEKITGIKAHILRYREQLIPMLIPRKDYRGRRIYSIRDVQLQMRIDCLLTKHRMTPDEAREQLLHEFNHSNSELMTSIAMLKAELIDLYMQSLKRLN